MNFPIYLKSPLLISFLSVVHIILYAQKTDSVQPVTNFRTMVSVTNNGVSMIPTFSLDKPAIIFDFSMGRRFTFDPLIRYALDGKPWSFIFWCRYKLIKPGRFQFTVGAHPSVLFKTTEATLNGKTSEIIRARQYLAAELYPYFMLTDKIMPGIYYNYSRGLAADDTRNTHYLAIRTGISGIVLPYRLSLGIMPQFYYLKMDNKDGTYFSSGFTLSRKGLPVSVSSVINKTIRSQIISHDFVWNITINYTINSQYIRRKE